MTNNSTICNHPTTNILNMTQDHDAPRNAFPHCYSATMHGRNLCGTENENRTIECYLWKKLQKAEAEVEELQQQKRNCIEILDDDAIEIAELKAANERLADALESCWHSANTYDGDYTAACDNVMHIVNATLKIANPEDK